MRRSLLLNLILALVWMAIVGSFTATNFLFGYAIGYFIIRIVQPLIETAHAVWRVRPFVEFALFFVRELFRASIIVAIDALTPKRRYEPGVIAVPLELDTDDQITLFANVMSLTPGTLSLDVSDDRRTLYIHVMYIQDRDVEKARRRIKEGVERRMRKAFGADR